MGKSISEIKKEFENSDENSWEKLCGFYATTLPLNFLYFIYLKDIFIRLGIRRPIQSSYIYQGLYLPLWRT